MNTHQHQFQRSKPTASVETCACGKFRFTENAGPSIIEQKAASEPESPRVKVVVCVDGGVVYGVYSNLPYESVDVLLVDHDDLEAEGLSRDEREAVSDRHTRSLMEHYIERPNVPESRVTA